MDNKGPKGFLRLKVWTGTRVLDYDDVGNKKIVDCTSETHKNVNKDELFEDEDGSAMKFLTSDAAEGGSILGGGFDGAAVETSNVWSKAYSMMVQNSERQSTLI